VSGQFHTLTALPPRKEPRYPFDGRLAGSQSRSGRHGEHSWSHRDSNDPSVVQSVASRYTDYTIADPSEPVGIIHLHTKFHMHRFNGSLVIAFKPKHRYPPAVMFSYFTRKPGIKSVITIQNSRTLHDKLRSRKLTLRHVGITGDRELNITLVGHLLVAWCTYEVHANPAVGSNVIRGYPHDHCDSTTPLFPKN
jgi:hypothetical protein